MVTGIALCTEREREREKSLLRILNQDHHHWWLGLVNWSMHILSVNACTCVSYTRTCMSYLLCIHTCVFLQYWAFVVSGVLVDYWAVWKVLTFCMCVWMYVYMYVCVYMYMYITDISWAVCRLAVHIQSYMLHAYITHLSILLQHSQIRCNTRAAARPQFKCMLKFADMIWLMALCETACNSYCLQQFRLLPEDHWKT